MKNVTFHTGVLHIVDRMKNTRNGNPRYLVTFDGYTCRTKADADYSYDLKNLDGKVCVGTIGTHYGNQTLRSIRGAQEK